MRRKLRFNKNNIRFAIVLFIVLSILMHIINISVKTYRKDMVSYRIESVAEFQMKNAIEKYVNYAQNWTNLLIANNGKITQEKFNEITQKMNEQYNDKAIRCIQLAPKGVIKYAYPLKGFESAIDGDLFSGHRKKECELARDTGEPTMNGPYELTQGGVSCILRQPLYLEKDGKKEFWGFSIVVLYFPEMLADVDLKNEDKLYDYKLTHLNENTGKREVILESGTKKLNKPIQRDFDVPNGKWRIEATWRGGWISIAENILELSAFMLLTIGITLIYSLVRRTRDAQRAMAELINNSDDAISVIDIKNEEVLMVNKAGLRMWPQSGTFKPGITYNDFYYPGVKPAIELEELLELEDRVVSNPVTHKELSVKIRKIKYNSHDAILVRTTEYDAEFFDTLTHLPNMNYFRQRGREIAEEYLSTRKNLHIIYMDIKGIKKYNSTYSYADGDILLENFSKVLKDIFVSDLICRFADDHFVIMSGSEHVERDIRSVSKLIKNYSKGLPIEIRAGIARLVDADMLMTTCDNAKLAEDSVKNSVDTYYAHYNDSMKKNREIYDSVIEHINKAIENDYIRAYYQPVIDTATNKLVSFEALARWEDPHYGMLNPGLFIPALEESHQIHKLDLHMLRLICIGMSEAREEGITIYPVSFNLSRLDFVACDIFNEVEKILAEYKIERNLLHIEVTESMFVEDDAVRLTIKKFRDVGYEVWMDDFGSGYSSLNVLKDYEFDEIKIDMIFLSSFTEKSKKIIRSTVELAKSLGIRTLAEGVETKEQYEFLQSIGCERAQGYLFSKPVPLTDIKEFIKKAEF